MRANIGIDLDGVICDTYPDSFKLLKELYPDNVTHDDLTCDWSKDFNLTDQQISDCFVEAGTRGLFRELPPYEDCIETLKKLADKFNIYIVTWRNYIPNAREDTLYWLDSNKIPYHKLVITRNKAAIAEDEKFVFYMDDTVHMCNSVAKTGTPTYLLSRLGNMNYTADEKVTRLDCWKDVEKILKI